MEPRFGKDFSNVRVHSDAQAVEAAEAVQAHAFTAGRHIVLGAGEDASGTMAGRSLLAHELAHVVQQSSPGAVHGLAQGGKVLLQRQPWQPDPGGPTYGNVPRDLPAPGSSGKVVTLENIRGTWKEVGPRYTRTARGSYDFVVMDGKIKAIKVTRTTGVIGGHTEAAQGRRVNWAGQVEFEAGKVQTWNDGSGHYKPLSSTLAGGSGPGFRQPAVEAGLPDDKFVQHTDNAVRPRGAASAPQLPVHQPATRPRTPGEPPKVGPGPARMEEFAARYGKPPPTVPAPEGVMPASEPVILKPGSVMPAGGVKPPVSLGKFAVSNVRSLAVGTLVTAAVMAGFSLAWAWVTYEKNVGPSEEERRLAKLFAQKVAPGVNQALTLHAAQAEEMTNNAPEFPVYANVTVELEERWSESGVAGNPTDRVIMDARFIGLSVSFKKVSKEQEVDSYGGSTRYAIKRVTYPVEIDFGETKAERQWRQSLHQAGEVVRRGLSARSVAEGTHWGGNELTPWEKRQDEQRRNFGLPTLAEQRAYDERETWVLAYIEYTAFHGPDDQYADAVRYLDEIRRRPRPIPGAYLPMQTAKQHGRL